MCWSLRTLKIAKFEAVLQKHGVVASRTLVDDLIAEAMQWDIQIRGPIIGYLSV